MNPHPSLRYTQKAASHLSLMCCTINGDSFSLCCFHWESYRSDISAALKFCDYIQIKSYNETSFPAERSHAAKMSSEAIGGRIVDLLVYDIRFPTSIGLDGSDASHPDPDYSATYVILKTGF